MAADGSIVVQADIDDKQAQTELKKLEKQIDTLNDKISDKQQEKMPLVEEAKKAAAYLDEAKKKLNNMQSGEEFFPAASVKAQAETVKSLQKDFDSAQKKVEAMDASISKETIKLNRMKDAAAGYQARLAGAKNNFNGISSATDAANKHLKKFTNRIIGLARRVFVFTLITKALRSIKDYMWSAIQTNEEAMASVARLQGALRTLAQPILNVLIPAFTVLVNVITRVINALSRLISMIFGTTAEASAKAAKNLYAEQKALKGVGSAAKKAGQSLAAFDEINTLSSSDSSGTGGASSAGGIVPDFTSTINDALSAILELFTGAALLALGAILTFSGINIPLGIALMSIGALAMWDAVTTNWSGIKELLQGSIGDAIVITSTVLMVFGALLLFSGANIGLGIGLLIAGVVGIASVTAANWDTMKDTLTVAIGKVLAVIGASLLAIGVLLLFSGVNTGLGFGLMIAGIATLGVGAVMQNWELISSNVQKVVSGILKILGSGLFVVGALFLFSGVNSGLGLGLMIAGVAALGVGSIAENWTLISSKTQNSVSALLRILGVSLLVIGALFLFTGVNIPLGLGLMLAGGAALGVSAVVPHWDAIQKKLKDVWASIKNWWNTNCAKYFKADYWKNIGSNIIDSFLNGLKSKFETVKSWASGAASRLKTKITVGGGAGRSSFAATQSISPDLAKNFKVPALATGAVIPPNKEFLAVLGDQKSGTNIETPLATMVDAFKQAMAESGGGTTTVVIQLDGKEIARSTVKNINNMTRAAGKPVLLY